MTLFAATGCIVSPDPLTEQEHMSRFLSDKADLAQMQDIPTRPISLNEAIARTLLYNLDNHLAQMEEAFSLNLLDAAKLQMLPRLALNSGYTIRNNEGASTSISYQTRDVTLQPSVSAPVNRITGDLSFSWSLLDFGLSYFQAKQQANKYLIMVERRRRIMNNLIKEVIVAYYNLASLENIRPRVEDAMSEAEQALATYRQMEQKRSGPVNQALEMQRSILTLLGQLRQLSIEVPISRARLAALMNLPQGTPFDLTNDSPEFVPPQLAASLEELENIGIFLRADLREESYQSRINRDEVKKEMLRMFPGITAHTSRNYDSNKYLENNFWYETGTRATMDLLGLAARYKQMQAAKTQTEVSRIRRLASTVAAMVQVDMSFYQYRQAVDLFNDSTEINRIDTRLLEVRAAEAKTRSIGRIEHVMQRVASVHSQLAADRKRIDVMTSWANLYFSIGGDILGDTAGCESLESMMAVANSGVQNWLAGMLPTLPDMPLQCLVASDQGLGSMETLTAGFELTSIAEPADHTALIQEAYPVAALLPAPAATTTQGKPENVDRDLVFFPDAPAATPPVRSVSQPDVRVMVKIAAQ